MTVAGPPCSCSDLCVQAARCEEHAAALLVRARDAATQGQAQGALSLFNQYLFFNPQHAAAYEMKAQARRSS